VQKFASSTQIALSTFAGINHFFTFLTISKQKFKIFIGTCGLSKITIVSLHRCLIFFERQPLYDRKGDLKKSMPIFWH